MEPTAAAGMTPWALRFVGIDALKALGCVLIVGHHLAFYGPMSDVVHTALPGLLDWLSRYGRMAVQVFLVVGGFLAAGSLAPRGKAVFREPGRLILRRYQRLALPLVVAVFIAVFVAAIVRPWLVHPSVPEPPTLLQLLAHLLLLQDLLGQEALSAGIWYVAIDFQLFVMSVALLTLCPESRHRWLVLAVAAGSLLVFNRYAGLDMSGLYFFGSYALGMVAWWATHDERPAIWLLTAALLGGLALALEFRGRLLVALAVAGVLVWLQRGGGAPRCLQASWLVKLGQMSYSVFLIHFAVCLLVNAVVVSAWPQQLMANSLGMVAAFALSLLGGWALHRYVESPVAPWRGMRLPSFTRL